MITFSKGLLLYMEIRKELGMFVRGAVVAIIALKYTCVSSYGIKKYIRNISSILVQFNCLHIDLHLYNNYMD